jgi:hypothetical protein
VSLITKSGGYRNLGQACVFRPHQSRSAFQVPTQHDPVRGLIERSVESSVEASLRQTCHFGKRRN